MHAHYYIGKPGFYQSISADDKTHIDSDAAPYVIEANLGQPGSEATPGMSCSNHDVSEVTRGLRQEASIENTKHMGQQPHAC